jgi:hypothetical protein
MQIMAIADIRDTGKILVSIVAIIITMIEANIPYIEIEYFLIKEIFEEKSLDFSVVISIMLIANKHSETEIHITIFLLKTANILVT